ncbi:MAG: IS200/IS605 family transposase [Flavisolibacter sp.]
MAHTYTQLYIQLVFAVKWRQASIHPSWEDELYKYITGIVQNKESKMLSINGMQDHVHIFLGYNPIITIPDLVKSIKVGSNKWVNDNRFVKQNFAWQDGYGAFSYGRSQLNDVCLYIQNQKSHHKKKTFKQEYTDLLKAFDVDFDEKYLFEFFD